MGSLFDDLRYGLRMLRRTPLLSTVAILTIALGVSLTTHTFSVVYGSVLRGLPIRDADRFMMVRETNLAEGITRMSLPIHDYLDFREQLTTFEDLGAAYQGTVNIAGIEGPPVRYSGGFVSANLLDMLGVPPLMGRTFQEGEDLPGAAPTIVLGYTVWRNDFASAPDVVGRSIRVNGEPATVIGVMPEGFRFPFEEDVWVPHRIDAESTPRRGGSFVQVAGHLREGVTLEAANAELAAIATRIEEQYPEANEGISAFALSYEEDVMPDEITLVLYLMLGAVFGVLLIACANVANLLLARAAVRQREVAVRTALGANRWHVIRQLMAESLLLALAGGVLGALFAYVGTTIFANSLVDIEKPYWIDVRTDLPALLFTMGISLLAALLAGTMPALRASGANFGSLLRDESRGSSSLRLGRFSAGLVVFELALSCALLVAAGFMTLSIINVNSVELGFDPSRTLTARLGLFEQDYPDQPARQQFFQRLTDRFREEPAIETVALASHLPSGGRAGLMRWFIGIEGESYSTDADYPLVNATYVTEGFFESFGVEVLQGRDLRPSEVWSGAEHLAIVNESFVARYFADRDPLGQRFRPGRGGSDAPWYRIIGVVPDMRVAAGVGGIGDDELTPESIYVNMVDNDPRFLSLVLRTQGPPQQMSRRAREVVASLDPNLPIYWIYTMQQVIDDSTWAFGIFGTTFAIFGLAALFLAAVGLYGVVSFSVARRRPEMGLRMALGAETADIYRLVFRRVLIQLAVGLAIGVSLGFGLAQPLGAVMFAVDTTGVGVYLLIVACLATTGLVATFFPAYRATRVDPLTALRPE